MNGEGRERGDRGLRGADDDECVKLRDDLDGVPGGFVVNVMLAILIGLLFPGARPSVPPADYGNNASAHAQRLRQFSQRNQPNRGLIGQPARFAKHRSTAHHARWVLTLP